MSQTNASLENLATGPPTGDVDTKETENAVERSTRSRTLTEKGKEYQITLFTKKFSLSKTRITRQCEILSQALETSNYELVQQELSTLDKFFAEAEENHIQLVDLLPDESQLDQQNERGFIDSQVF